MQTNSERYSEWARKALDQFIGDQPEYIAIDTETEGLAFYDKPFCVTVAWADTRGGSISPTSHYFELGVPEVEEALKSILASTEHLVFHNAKFDLQKLALVGLINPDELDPLKVWDTECLYHLLDEHGVKRLKVLAKEILNEETDEDEVLKVERRKHKLRKEDGYHNLPRDVLIPYALKDAEFTIRLFWKLQGRVLDNPDLSRLLRLEQKLTFTLLRMESRGMGVDLDYTTSTTKTYASEALAKEMEIRDLTYEEFNPQSPKQIAEYFITHGIKLTGTDKASLKGLNHPLSEAILQLRKLKKMHGTYLKPMLMEQQDGIIHPSFRQHGTRTGRMSSGGQGYD